MRAALNMIVTIMKDGHHSVRESMSMYVLHITFYLIDGTYCKTVIGAVDYAWLFTYAVFMVGRY